MSDETAAKPQGSGSVSDIFKTFWTAVEHGFGVLVQHAKDLPDLLQKVREGETEAIALYHRIEPEIRWACKIAELLPAARPYAIACEGYLQAIDEILAKLPQEAPPKA